MLMRNQLKQYAYNKSSQLGEDGIVQKVFEVLPVQDENWCVEFGAWDGKHLSNTYELISNHRWKGVLIEGSKKRYQDLLKTYSNNSNATLINKFVHFEGADTLDNILNQTDIPVNFDLLSIDIDGNDYHIWESLTKYLPKVVIIEFNPSIPSDIEFVQKKDIRINHGNSLLSLVKLGKKKGYELIATTNTNGFFVRKEYFDLFKISDNSIASIWDTEAKAPRIFQLYDGTLALTEDFQMYWSNNIVQRFDLQKLPSFLRQMGDSKNAKGVFNKIRKRIYYSLHAQKNEK